MGKARLVALGAATVVAAMARGVGGRGSLGGHVVPGRLPDDRGRIARDARARLRRLGAREADPVIFLHGNNDTPFPTACNGSARSTTSRRHSSTAATRRARSGARLPGRPVRPRRRRRRTGPRQRTRRRERGRPRAVRQGRPRSTPARSASTSSATASAGRSPANGCAVTTPTTRAPPGHDPSPHTGSSIARRRR